MLTNESADAMRECLRILAPMMTPDERGNAALVVETYITEGKWVPTMALDHIAPLFYPRDPARAAKFHGDIVAAIASGELALSILDRASVTELAAWPACPRVPLNSPLRFWLPAFMVENGQPEPTPGRPLPALRWQEREIIRSIRELGHDPAALPKSTPGKSGIRAAVRDSLQSADPHRWTDSIFKKAWQRVIDDNR